MSAGRNATETAGQNAANAEQSEATQPAILAPESGGNLLLGGSASAEKRAMGRKASARGGASSQTGANRDGLVNNTGSEALVDISKDEPAPTAEPAAQ